MFQKRLSQNVPTGSACFILSAVNNIRMNRYSSIIMNHIIDEKEIENIIEIQSGLKLECKTLIMNRMSKIVGRKCGVTEGAIDIRKRKNHSLDCELWSNKDYRRERKYFSQVFILYFSFFGVFFEVVFVCLKAKETVAEKLALRRMATLGESAIGSEIDTDSYVGSGSSSEMGDDVKEGEFSNKRNAKYKY